MTGLSEFDTLVTDLMARTGCARARAETIIRQQVPHAAPAVADHDAEAAARILEKQEQVEVRKLLIAYGFKVYNLSQARATKQTPGLPDLWCVHKREPIAFWFETKRQVGGQLSPAQVDFQAECLRCDVKHFVGHRHNVVELLLSLGLAERCAGSAYGIEPTSRARGH